MKIRMVMTIITMNITKHIYNCKQYESESTRISSTYESNMQALEMTEFGESPYKNVGVLS
jgi:hypothetical protein